MITPPGQPITQIPEDSITSSITGWLSQLRHARTERQAVWDECWAIYRGALDASDKEDWQAKIAVPKAWNAVEQAVSLIRRILQSTKEPWWIEPLSPEYAPQADRLTKLVRLFLEKAEFDTHFYEGLKIAFITGIGIWKVWWGVDTRDALTVTPEGIQRGRHLEGRLFLRAVDPNTFFWLPGSRFNDWTGTIELHEIPRHQLLRMADEGLFPRDRVEQLATSPIEESLRASATRFGEHHYTPPIPTVTLIEYFGPLFHEDRLVEECAHVIIANNTVLRASRSIYWNGKPPYVAFSPLPFPLRDHGVGLIEMNRFLLKALNQVTNMSVDMLLYRLLPIFEVNPLVYDNPEDLQQLLKPGTTLSRSQVGLGQPGINAIQYPDISSGTMAVMAALDRAIQEGSLISEIQQAIPRWRGIQTATEVSIKAENQTSFFGSLATEIEEHAIKPIIRHVIDYIVQFLISANDPRIPAILGLDSLAFATMSREQLASLVVGDFNIRVAGITEHLQQAENLQALVQLVNILGQNPQEWLPYVNQSELLRRILHAFRPTVSDIDKIIRTPEEAQAILQQQAQQQAAQSMLQLLPQLLQQQP